MAKSDSRVPIYLGTHPMCISPESRKHELCQTVAHIAASEGMRNADSHELLRQHFAQNKTSNTPNNNSVDYTMCKKLAWWIT